jgi:hypothetical protein
MAILANYANLMPSDNSASFETSVADWSSETPANASIVRYANAAIGTYGMRATILSTGGFPTTISQTTRSTVTAGNYYQVGLCWASNQPNTTSTTVGIAVRWYNSTGTLISTSASTTNSYPSGTGATVDGYLTGSLAAPVRAPAGAATASIALALTVSPGASGAYHFDFDAIGFYGASTAAALPSAHMAYIAPSAGATSGLYSWFGNTGAISDVFAAPLPTTGLWHHVAWAPKAATAAATVFTIDGVVQTSVGTVANTNASYGIATLAYVGPNGSVSTGIVGDAAGCFFTGQIAGVWLTSPATGLINVSQVYSAQHYNYGTTSAGSARTHDFPSELTSQRVNDVLTAIAFPPSMLALETGLTTMTASGNVAGTTATALIEAAADAELGNVFVDPSGVVRFHNRSHRNSPTSVATFGGDGNIPYEGNIVIDFDDTYVYNDIQVTQAGASPAYVYEIQDVTSQNTYGVRSLPTSIQVVNQSDVQGMGATLLGRYKDPHPRLATLSFELRSKPTYLATVMALKIGDLITVNHKPLGGTTYTLQVFIDGISHTVDEGQWLITFNTTPLYGPPAPPAPQAPGTYPAVYTATY